MIGVVLKYKYLIWQLTKRDIVGRYRGSFLGLIWSFVNPLIMLTIYTFVFGFVFQARFGTHMSSGRAEYAVILFAGLIIYYFLSECFIKSPNLIVDNVNYVKKVVFPLEALSLSCVFAAFFHLCISLLILLGFYVFLYHSIQWTIVFFPMILLPLIIMAMGISWFISALGVFVRDIGQMINVLVLIMLFLSPIFYPVENLPHMVRNFIYLNPLTFVVVQARSVLLWGKMPDWTGLSIYFLVSVIFAVCGFYWFNKVRGIFADVL